MVTVAELIKDKDYSYIEWRVRMPQEMHLGDVFFGACKAENGNLIPLDGDSIYCTNETVLRSEIWTDKLGRKCLTIVVPYREVN